MAKTPSGKNTSGRGQRDLKVKVKTARGRKLSSTRWLERQLNDPYVKRANAEGYRGRAAFKILELDDKFRFLVPGARVVDLGCAPGGWLQVAVKRVNALGEKSGKRIGTVLGVDLQEVEPVAGATAHVLEDGGTFVAKVLAGGAEGDLQKLLKQKFEKVANVKPPASRSDSSESFVVATGFRGGA
jgi:23S rRNA (uridine2552-2'-O)-methyltransferase